MAMRETAIEFRNFEKGFITETNYLDMPADATLDEVNFDIDTRGVRRRRLGLQYESGQVVQKTGTQYSVTDTPMITSYLWRNVAGFPGLTYLAVQFNNRLFVYNTESDRIAGGILTTGLGLEISTDTTDRTPFDYVSVDGDLIVTNGSKTISIVSAVGLEDSQSTPSFTIQQERLLIRDTFGLDVQYELASEGNKPISLQDPRYVGVRPKPEGAFVPTNFRTTFSTALTSSTLYYSPNPPSRGLATFGSSESFTPQTWKGDTLVRIFIRGNVPTSATYVTPTVEFTINTSETTIIVSNFPLIGSKTLTKNSKGTFVWTITDAQAEAFRDYIWDNSDGEKYTKYPLVVNGSTTYLDAYERFKNITFSIERPQPPATTGTIPANIRSHLYNLRNQTWSKRRLCKGTQTKQDPVSEFLSGSSSTEFPANTDNIYAAYYPDASDTTNKTAYRFHGTDLWGNPSGNMPAPKGYFIIDALDRSDSRLEQWKELANQENYTVSGAYEYLVDGAEVSLPYDITSGGARAVSEYAGRIWYGGFSGDGDKNATRLESFLLYSQLTNSRSGYWRCYQEGDPTSYDAPDLLETDGGVVPLDGAYGVQRLVQIGNALVVFAANGVWAVSGNDGNLFSPTSQRVYKITDKSSLSARSIAVVDNAVFFWTLDGIYRIVIGESSTSGESLQLTNITEKTIHSYYTAIPPSVKEQVAASFDPYDGYISWTWNNTVNRTDNTQILRLSLRTGAFSKYVISEGASSRTVLAPLDVIPFYAGRVEEDVVVDGDIVQVDADDVIVTYKGVSDRPTTSKMLVAVELTGEGGGELGLYFADFSNESFLDWGEEDASAYIVTAYYTGEDTMKEKRVRVMTCHFEKTESVLEDKGDGDYDWDNPSSCMVQTQWDWSDDVNSNRWGRPFEAYRMRQHYIPDNIGEVGKQFATVVSKNKLRGSGIALSMKFSTSPEKDCRLLGFGFGWTGNSKI